MLGIDTYIQKHVRENPSKVAISFCDQAVTYSELSDMCQLMAVKLQEYNLSPGDVVAVICERSIELMVSILAVLKLGCVYLPIDKLNPKPRIEYILSNSQACLIITDEDLDLNSEWPQISINDLAQSTKQPAKYIEDRENRGFCIMYTSGTTGNPKGAVLPKLGVFNHLHSKIDCVSMSKHSIMAQTAGYYFVNSIWQIFCPLVVGAQMAIYDRYVMGCMEQFADRIQRDRVHIFQVVPTFLERFLDFAQQKEPNLQDLQCVVSSSEKLTVSLAERCFKVLPDVRLVNAYGMTECSDDVLHYVLDVPPAEQQDMPIGSPIPHTRIYVINDQEKVCNVNEKGEICVAGIGLSDGYLNAPEQTSLAFVEGSRFGLDETYLYRTGDIGYLKEDGDYVYLGRKDYQVKIGGFRVELYEIESVLLKHPDITQAAVICIEESEKKIMVAFYAAERVIYTRDIDLFLRSLLPGYMVPMKFVHLQKFPLTAMEKIDRKKLYAHSYI